MFFTSGIIIAFFCFAFYLIWNQFLRKDTRLNTGLQVLRKKISDLENLSLTVESQVDRQMSLVSERARRMESLLKQGKELCEKLEKNLNLIKDLDHLSYEKSSSSVPTTTNKKSFNKTPLEKTEKVFPIENSPSHLKMVKEVNKQKKFHFGKSPFTQMDFVESCNEDNLDSSP